MVIAHGLGEHSGRYGNIINELKGSNVSVYALDHRGHGKSGGKIGHVESFMDYVYDLKIFIDLIKEDINDNRLILLGHSMGGVIAGRLLDLFAPRWIITAGSLVTAGGFFLTPFISTPLQLYLDLKGDPGRGQDAAQEIFEREIMPRW